MTAPGGNIETAGRHSRGHQPRVVAVLGCGTIGASWAEAFLASGFDVRAWDPRSGYEQALLSSAARHGRTLQVCNTAASAVLGAQVIQESIPESQELKTALYANIAVALDPTAVVASSTSTIMPTALQQGCAFAERLLVGHPFNPPHIVPLVEVVGGARTSEESIELAMSFYRDVGKHPIRLRTERPGHLANRLQAALWREAVDAVASGQADVADVDAVITQALGPRWALTGPFSTFNLGGGAGGLRHFIEHLGPAFEALWDDARRPVVTASLKETLIAQTTRAQGTRSVAEIASARDLALIDILNTALTFSTSSPGPALSP
jgi:3-hydroxyacyl-CoA dehydrogenase